MRSRSQVRAAALVVAGLLSSAMILPGCSRGSGLPGPTGTVSGTASYQDKPIPEGSTIVFVHRESGIIGTGVTDAEGNFDVQMRGGPQVLVGEYAVNITPPGELDENVNQITMETVPEAWKAIPKKYWFATTSTEAFTVAEGKNDYQLRLTD